MRPGPQRADRSTKSSRVSQKAIDATRCIGLGLSACVIPAVGNLFTSLEMMGVTLTLMKLDDELLECVCAPCQSVGVTIAGQPSGRLAYSRQESVRLSAPGTGTARDGAVREIAGPAISIDDCDDVVRDMIDTIVRNRQYLSEIDGLIGDGDHAINIAKGFSGCTERLDRLGARSATTRILQSARAAVMMHRSLRSARALSARSRTPALIPLPRTMRRTG